MTGSSRYPTALQLDPRQQGFLVFTMTLSKAVDTCSSALDKHELLAHQPVQTHAQIPFKRIQIVTLPPQIQPLSVPVAEI